MMSKIIWGQTGHARLTPTKHVFSYPIFALALNLSELEGSKFGLLFGVNRPAIFSVKEKDYLYYGKESISIKLAKLLKSKGITTQPTDIFLITTPRFLGYVFNPVSFYLLTNSDGIIGQVIAEVANTFGEKHIYLMENKTGQRLPATFIFDKAFFVSPFFEISGQYQFSVIEFGEKLNIRVALEHNGQPTFWADITGQARELTTANLWRTLLNYPLSVFLTMPRITYQAFKLYFLKNISPKDPKLAQSRETIRSKQNLFHKFRLASLGIARRRMRESANFRPSTLKES